MEKIYKHIKNNLLYYLIYIIFIIEAGINIKSKYLWEDESFTFHIIQHNFTNIIHITAQDVHPFLYYFIAKILTFDIQNIFTKIIMLKLISILPYLILLIISSTYIKNNFSKLTSEIFMFCIISMPVLIDNIGQIRMYGWATLFVILAYLLLISLYKNNNLKIALTISIFSLLSSYTHYYALITVAILYLAFLILFIINKKSIKYLISSIIIDIILYLPWLGVLLKQTKETSNNFWSSSISINDIIHMIIGNISPVRHFSIFYVLPIILLMLLIILSINRSIDNINIIGIIIPFILVLIGYIVSKIMGHSIIMDRYIISSLSIFWLSISIIISRLNNKYKLIKYLLIFIILITGIINYTKMNIHENKVDNQFNPTLQVLNKIPKNSAIIYNNSTIMYSTSNYINNNYLLPKRKIKDISFPIFNKAFNNIKANKGINLPKNYKHIYYIKSDRYNVNNYKFNSTFNSTFNSKYKINNKQQIGKVTLPKDGNGTIYKIK